MKITKIGLAIVAAAALIFAAGCAKDKTTVQPQPPVVQKKAPVHHTAYRSKFGTTSTRHDINK